jgi:hypothetical protein
MMGKKKTHSTPSIQVEDQGDLIMECTTQESAEQSIFTKVHKKQYTLAGEAPICNSRLFQDLGYTANTPASQAVLDSTYVAPTNSDLATKELFVASTGLNQKIQCQLSSPPNNRNNTGR